MKHEQIIFVSVRALDCARYASFQPAVYALAGEDIHLRKIAGQDKVQIKMCDRCP